MVTRKEIRDKLQAIQRDTTKGERHERRREMAGDMLRRSRKLRGETIAAEVARAATYIGRPDADLAPSRLVRSVAVVNRHGDIGQVGSRLRAIEESPDASSAVKRVASGFVDRLILTSTEVDTRLDAVLALPVADIDTDQLARLISRSQSS